MNEIKELKEKIEKKIEKEKKIEGSGNFKRLLLQSELRGMNETLSAISEDEIEFLKAIINHNWTIEQIKQEIGNRIKELKSKLQIPTEEEQ
jgi:hypothetical protein